MADSAALSGPPATRPARRALPSPTPLRPLLARLRPYVPQLVLGALALLLSSAIGLAFPLIVRELLDAAFVKGNGSLLNELAILLVVIFAVQGLLSFVQVWLITSVAERVIARLRSELFAHLVRLSPGFFSEQRTGELTSRLSTDLTLLQSVLTYQSTELARQLVYLIGGIVMLTITHPQLTVTTLAVVPVVVGAAFIFGRAMRKASTVVQDRVAEAMGTAEEAFGQIRTVQSFTRERAESERYDAQLRDVVDAAIHRALVRGVFFGVITFAGFAGVAAVLWQGGRLVLSHQLTGGALVEFLFYAFFVAAAVGALGQLFGAYQEAIGAARRVFDLLDTKPTIADPLTPLPLPSTVRGDVRVSGVTFRYGDELPDVLHDVTFGIAPGEVVALVGPSGAGKTTIASLLPRFWDVQRGSVSLEGIDVRSLALGDLRGAIGIVPQEPALFSGTVRDNIAYARPGATDAEVDAAARAAAYTSSSIAPGLP